MDYSPPPLFKQGASARAKVVVFALIAISLLIVDSKLRSLTVIRQVVGVTLYPVQVIALFPRDAAYAVGAYFSSLSRLKSENETLKRERIRFRIEIVIYRGFPRRLHHTVLHWVEPGALFHIRIAVDREKEQKPLRDPPLAQAILDSANPMKLQCASTSHSFS